MTVLKGANVTKYDAGGSGDNYIEDGYIKSVEKVWIDSYTATGIALGTEDTICIGRVPKGKKITEIVVYLPAMGDTATSLATVFLGTGASLVMTAGSCYFNSMKMDGTLLDTWDIGTASTLRVRASKALQVAPKDLDIYIRIYMANELDVTLTGGTIKSIIKYT